MFVYLFISDSVKEQNIPVLGRLVQKTKMCYVKYFMCFFFEKGKLNDILRIITFPQFLPMIAIQLKAIFQGHVKKEIPQSKPTS